MPFMPGRRTFGTPLLIVPLVAAAVGVYGYRQLVAIPADAARVSGAARIVDGDTLAIGGTKFRLWGINAAERDTRDGREATQHLKELTGGGAVTCIDTGKRSYGRVVGRCFDVDGYDLSASMVAHGYAWDWPNYSGGLYMVQQLQAQAAGKGLHASP